MRKLESTPNNQIGSARDSKQSSLMNDDFLNNTNEESQNVDQSKTEPKFNIPTEPDECKPTTIWKPISQIDKKDLLPFEDKQFEMIGEIGKLEQNNEEYFKGKQMRFDNQAHFFQCIEDPS